MSPGPGEVEYRVPYADADPMQVVYYGNYLRYFEMARNALLRNVGLPYAEIERRGIGFPVLEAHVEYRAPARYDDELRFRAWVGRLKPVRLRVECDVRRGATLLARGHTVHAVVDLATLRPVRLPAELAAHLQPLLGPATVA